MKCLTLLDKKEAGKIREKIDELNNYWVLRDQHSLYTLGASAYLDSPTKETVEKFSLLETPSNQYKNRIADNNHILWNNFEELYLRIQIKLSEELARQVVYASGKALPGFHIFNAHDYYSDVNSHVPHFDRQYEQLDWGTDVEVGTAETLSFTLPIELPKTGAGLYLWQVYLGEVLGMNKTSALAHIKKAQVNHHSYTLGEMLCHSGHQLHRIAPWRSIQGDQRITMQGHGILLDNIWHIYW